MSNSADAHLIKMKPDKGPRTIKVDPEVMRLNRVIMGLYNDPRADVFRVLRTNILKQLRENQWTTLAITSTAPGAGKSFVAVNLAIAIALEGNQSVLLVDADLRRPSVGRTLGIPTQFGLVDYLNGTAPLEEILVNPSFEGLTTIPGRYSSSNFSELLSSPKMAKLVQETKSRYDSRIIIYDIPPLFVADDALLFMSYVESALLVVEDGKSSPDELRHAMSLLEQTNMLGMVLNKSRRVPARYHYGYTYLEHKMGL